MPPPIISEDETTDAISILTSALDEEWSRVKGNA